MPSHGSDPLLVCLILGNHHSSCCQQSHDIARPSAGNAGCVSETSIEEAGDPDVAGKRWDIDPDRQADIGIWVTFSSPFS